MAQRSDLGGWSSGSGAGGGMGYGGRTVAVACVSTVSLSFGVDAWKKEVHSSFIRALGEMEEVLELE